jgi:hypothetical protein
MNTKLAIDHFNEYFDQISKKIEFTIEILIYSVELNLNYTYSADAEDRQPFHIAGHWQLR